MNPEHRRYVSWLLGLYSVEWAILAIAPNDRGDWAIENILVAVVLLTLVITYRAFPLSRVSYTLLFVFLSLHALGAHYTYAQVPYDQWVEGAFGTSLGETLGLERNHFDRLVHFLYGALLFYPIREVFVRIAEAKGFWAYLLPVSVLMSTSMLFEVFEWIVAEVVADELAAAYLGTQGDLFDAQKDMGLATVGALLAMGITLAVNLYLGRDVAREWADSLRVRRPEPMGEHSMAKEKPYV